MTMQMQPPPKPTHVRPPPPPPPKLRQIVRDITGKDLPPHEMRGRLVDWESENEEDVRQLVAHARAVKAGRPIKSYVMSADEMSDIVLRLFG